MSDAELEQILLCIPNLEDENGSEARMVRECFVDGMVSYGGAFVAQFERLVADASGAGFGAAMSSGTTALHAALHVLGVQPGDLVITPTLTFIASANAVSQCAASPWLMDVTRESWTLDPDQLERELTEKCTRDADGNVVHTPTGRRVAAILPVYMLGLPADMDRIADIAQRWGLPTLADGAAALGSTYKGKPVGQAGADLTAMSFNANKIITTGGGGMVIGNDEAMMKRLVHVSTTARDWKRGYHHDEAGFNYRLTNLCAAMGIAQMEKLDGFVAAKQRIAATYDEAFADLSNVAPFPTVAWAKGNNWFSGIYLPGWDEEQVTALRTHLGTRKISAPPFWKPIHMQPPYMDSPVSDVTVSEDLWTRILPLPCSTHLTDGQQQRVIDAVREFVAT